MDAVLLFGIHRADEYEFGRVRMGDSVTLDVNATHRRGVEKHVDQVVVKQIHLVDVQNSLVSRGEQSRLESALTVAENLLEVDGPDHSVLGGADGQFHQAGRSCRSGVVDRGQQRSQRAHDRRLGSSLLTADQDSTDPRMHSTQNQRQPQLILADHSTEREARHWSIFFTSHVDIPPPLGFLAENLAALECRGNLAEISRSVGRGEIFHSGGTAPGSNRTSPRTFGIETLVGSLFHEPTRVKSPTN